MIAKTSISALRALMYLARRGQNVCIPPRKIAEELKESPTCLAKVTRLLVKDGFLCVEMGSKGGVQLARPPSDITLLAVVEACQGTLVGDYCRPDCDLNTVCAYHRAAAKLQKAMSGVLSRRNLAQMLERPASEKKRSSELPCVILGGASPSVFAISAAKRRRVPES